MISEVSKVRALVDPNNTLPDVHLVVGNFDDEKFGVESEAPFEIQLAGEAVGRGSIAKRISEEDGEPFTTFTDITVWSNQGKGYGIAAYVCAIELCQRRGEVFRTDDTVSSSAKRVWERLAKLGVAEVVEEFESASDEGEGFKDFYHGHYEAIDPDFW